MYDIVAKTNKNNHGVADFDAHAIKISGGIIPKIVSETKKNENTSCDENVATRLLSNELKSRTNSSNPSNNKTKISTAAPPLKAVSFKNE